MAVLPSRRILPEKFLADFLATLRPGVIPLSDFIPWSNIKAKLRKYEEGIRFLGQFGHTVLTENPQEVADALLSADDPGVLVATGFELLGHTRDTFVSSEDSVSVSALGQAIGEGDAKKAERLVALWKGIGLENLLSGDLESEFLGVQVGLACNTRKNLGGKHYGFLIKALLEKIVKKLGLPRQALQEEERIGLGGGGQKTVDFALVSQGNVQVAFEVNFYTTSGSKPTEIKRAYADLNRRLAEKGITLVWITDGIGYQKMRRSLKDAFVVHANTYNYEMAREFLLDDLKEVLAQ